MSTATSSKRRSNRRWWASAFLAVAAAGAFASSSAAQAGELSSASACPASQISVSYEVGIDSTLVAYAVTGIRVTGFPTQCAGQRVAVTVHDAAWLMATTSDNTATNLLLDRIIIRRVWEKMESLGLQHTKVHSKTFLRISSVAMDSSVKYGLGVSTPNEMARLFTLLARGQAVSPAADSAMLDILEHNDDVQMLQRYLDGVRAAHKTGAVDDARTECSLFYLRSRVVACVFTKENADHRWVIDNEAQRTMAAMGAAIARAWGLPEEASVITQ